MLVYKKFACNSHILQTNQASGDNFPASLESVRIPKAMVDKYKNDGILKKVSEGDPQAEFKEGDDEFRKIQRVKEAVALKLKKVLVSKEDEAAIETAKRNKMSGNRKNPNRPSKGKGGNVQVDIPSRL